MDSGYPGFKQQFSKTFGERLKKAVSLREYAHFKVGGLADYFFSATSISDLIQAFLIARGYNMPYYIIGGGYNLLFDDDGFRGLIIKNDVQGLKITGAAEIQVLAGTPISELVEFCIVRSLSGFEFLAGIPGTVGGAVFGNAGAFDCDIGDFLKEALILDRNGEQLRVDRDYFDFDYRQSRLRTSRDLLLRATFKLKSGTQQEIKDKIAENLKKRENKHPPWDVACAGSYFKNPVQPDGERIAAARLLDQVGAKNLRIGGAAVFSGHANFIINKQGATAQDILQLARELKKRVKQEFGIVLEEEVIYLPAELPMP
jgi:UDP-N-acetylmuramate dehydrogenase